MSAQPSRVPPFAIRRGIRAVENARAETIVTVLPRISKDPDGALLMELPKQAGYDTVRAPSDALGSGKASS